MDAYKPAASGDWPEGGKITASTPVTRTRFNYGRLPSRCQWARGSGHRQQKTPALGEPRLSHLFTRPWVGERSVGDAVVLGMIDAVALGVGAVFPDRSSGSPP